VTQSDKFSVDDAIKVLRVVRDAFPSASGYSTVAAMLGVALMIGCANIAHAIREPK
jgi:hypothetical protein